MRRVKNSISMLFAVILAMGISLTGVPAKGYCEQLSVGNVHTVVIEDGSVWGWGESNMGALGNSSTPLLSTPVPAQASFDAPPPVITSLDVGPSNTFALDSEGNVWTWGWNKNGRLGIGSYPPYKEYLPVKLDSSLFGGSKVIKVAAPFALTDSGEVYSWGDGWVGQLGRDHTGDFDPSPGIIDPSWFDGPVIDISSAIGPHTLALTSKGTVYSWGDNSKGQLGIGNSVANYMDYPVPVTFEGLTGRIVSIGTGSWNSYAIDTEGNLWSWGDGWVGQLGLGMYISPWQDESGWHFYVGEPTKSNEPALIGNVVSASAGGPHGLVLTKDGQVLGFGHNQYGQIGNLVAAGGASCTSWRDCATATPTLVGLPVVCNAVAVSANGGRNSGAMCDDGRVYAWGINPVAGGGPRDQLGPEGVGLTYSRDPLLVETFNPPALSAPENVVAEEGDGQIALYWAPVAGATSYKIYWNSTGGVSASDSSIVIPAGATTYPHTGLSDGTTYYYAVAAVHPDSTETLSAEVSARLLGIINDVNDERPIAPNNNIYYGASVSIDGDYAVVGATYENLKYYSASGAAHVFQRDPYSASGWIFNTSLPNQPTTFDAVSAVSISGAYVVMGAVGNDCYVGTNCGKAFVFKKDPLTDEWTGHDFIAETRQKDAVFGSSVNISEDYMIVGSVLWDEGSNADTGAVYVYERKGTNTWSSEIKLISPNPASVGYFGVSVSLSGDYAIVGEMGQNKAHIYRRTGTETWELTATLIPDASTTGISFGSAVSIDGNYAIVGARGDDNVPGAAYVFRRVGIDTWDSGTRIEADIPTNGDSFGMSVSIKGDRAVVGAPDYFNSGAGAVYLFRRAGIDTWDSISKYTAPEPEANANFGFSVDLDENRVIVGERDRDFVTYTNAGAAYILE